MEIRDGDVSRAQYVIPYIGGGFTRVERVGSRSLPCTCDLCPAAKVDIGRFHRARSIER